MFKAIDIKAGLSSGERLLAALKVIAANFGLLEPSVTVAATPDYVPVIADRVISRTNASAQTLTVPNSSTAAFDIGHVLRVLQSGAGALTIAAAGGVTLNKLTGKSLVCAGQYGVVRLIKVAANTWNVSGDLT